MSKEHNELTKILNSEINYLNFKLDNKSIIVIKSTVLPKYIEDILEISENLVINPEFLRENFANEDFINSEIIVFGGDQKNVDSASHRTWVSHSRMCTI